MKKHTSSLLLSIAAAMLSVTALPTVAFAATWECNFEKAQPGDLVGQDGWATYTPSEGVTATSPKVKETKDSARARVVGQTAFEGKSVSRARKFITPIYRGAGNIVVEFDARATDGNSLATFGFGSSSQYPASVGIQFGVFVVREEKFDGQTRNAVDADGKRVCPVQGNWYRIRSEWTKDAASGEWRGTLAIKNLTKGETDFTSLFFDRAQTVKSAPLGIDPKRPASEFKLVAFRTGTPGGELANLSVSTRQ